MGRRVLYRVHAWIGLNLGFLLFVVCFSGTIAVFSPELNWLADPSLRVRPPADIERQPMSWQAMHDRVAAAYPQALVVSLEAPHGNRFAARAAIAYSSRDLRWVLVNPFSGELLAQKSAFNLVSFFRIFHKQFYIVPSVFRFHGTLIVGALAILLLAGVVTGLLSGKRWWRAFVRLRCGRSRRLFWSDLHRMAGVWPLIVTLILSLTGAWYLAERILLDAGALVEEPPVHSNTSNLRHRPVVLEPLDLDRAAALAQAAYPELTIAHVRLPTRPGAPLVFTGQAEAWLVRDRANQVQMDPYSGKILHIRRAAALSPFDRWIETADPLHFGTFAGLPGRLIWLVAGLLICATILAGLYNAWLRYRPGVGRSRGRRFAAMATLPTLVVMVAGIFGTWAYGGEALRSAQRSVGIVPLLAGKLGPWELSVVRYGPAEGASGPVQVGISFDGDGHPNFEHAMLWTGDPGKPEKARPVERFIDRLAGRVLCPQGGRRDQCRMNLRIDEWDGTRHSISIDLWPPSAGASGYRRPVAAGMSVGEYAVITVFTLCILLPLAGWMKVHFS